MDFAEAFHGDPRTGPSRVALPLPTAARPPGYARVFYKVVARVGQRFLSVYDGAPSLAPSCPALPYFPSCILRTSLYLTSYR